MPAQPPIVFLQLLRQLLHFVIDFSFSNRYVELLSQTIVDSRTIDPQLRTSVECETRDDQSEDRDRCYHVM